MPAVSSALGELRLIDGQRAYYAADPIYFTLLNAPQPRPELMRSESVFREAAAAGCVKRVAVCYDFVAGKIELLALIPSA